MNPLFPATRFYGSKRKHLDWIEGCLGQTRYESVLDLFGGTGSVSMLFESLGKAVKYHDSANFNYRQAKALFAKACSFDLANLSARLKSVKPESGFITKNFGGQYFKDKENRWLDGYLSLDEQLANRAERDALFYAVAQACLQKRPFNLFHRRNLHLRLSQVDRTFGNAVIWEKSFAELAIRHLIAIKNYTDRPDRLACVEVLKSTTPTKVVAQAELVYIDPPYIRRDRKNEFYAQRYHFVDGLSSPRIWKDWVSRNQADWFHSSAMNEPWEEKGSFLDLLTAVLDRHKHSTCLMSYMDDGYPSSTTLIKIFKDRFRVVRTFRRRVQRALSGTNSCELMILGE